MSDQTRRGHDPRWPVRWEDARHGFLEMTLESTPAQRLAWLEEVIELAYATGALPRRREIVS